MASLPFEQRLSLAPAARRLLDICARKQTTLCVSLDLPTTAHVLTATRALAPFVCAVKFHIDALPDFTHDAVRQLVQLSRERDFMLFEDRKYSDIGNTVKMQYKDGPFKVVEWAELVTVHAIAGVDAVGALSDVAEEYTKQQGREGAVRGCLIVAELSCHGNLISAEYTSSALSMIEKNDGASHPFVAGFIASRRLPLPPRCDGVFLTPGVHLESRQDGHGQRYRGVEEVVSGGSDVIIVGRGVLGEFAKDGHVEGLVQRAQRYRTLAWKAYEKRVGISH